MPHPMNQLYCAAVCMPTTEPPSRTGITATTAATTVVITAAGLYPFV